MALTQVSKNLVKDIATLDANAEVVEMPAGAAASNVHSKLRADGTWHRPGTHDFVKLSANFYPSAATTFLTVSGWPALQLANFTEASGVFTCAKAGRYRVAFSASSYNATLAMRSIISRLLFSTAGVRGTQFFTFASTAVAYGALPPSESIIDMAVGDTFIPQFYVGSTANGNCYLRLSDTNITIEEL